MKPCHRDSDHRRDWSATIKPYLLLKVAKRIVIGICQEVVDIGMRQLHPILEVVHQMRSVALRGEYQPKPYCSPDDRTYPDLLGAGDCAEYDLAKASRVKWTICDATDYLIASFDNGHTPVIPIKDKPRDILAWHFRQLTLEDVFQACQ